jgi:acyl-CoA thioester hydrolase
MNQYLKFPEIRWADLDPNFHVRHSVYYDWAAYSRICFLEEHGLTPLVFAQHNFGPILFREECSFRKELHFSDTISIDLQLLKARTDFSRWSIRHTIYKNKETVAATITVDGAWIDTQKRKLAMPPAMVTEVFNAMPQTTDFEWINK